MGCLQKPHIKKYPKKNYSQPEVKEEVYQDITCDSVKKEIDTFMGYWIPVKDGNNVVSYSEYWEIKKDNNRYFLTVKSFSEKINGSCEIKFKMNGLCDNGYSLYIFKFNNNNLEKFASTTIDDNDRLMIINSNNYISAVRILNNSNIENQIKLKKALEQKLIDNEIKKQENEFATQFGNKPYQNPKTLEVPVIKNYILKYSNDPSSIQFIEWKKIEYCPNSGYFITVLIRGKNAFGAKIITTNKFIIANDEIKPDLDCI